MDLIIDCIPYNGFDDKLYEMLEDDMKTFANLNCSTANSLSSSSSSPSCLSDEEQLAALSNRTNLIDEFLIFSSPPPPPQATNHQTYNHTQGMNHVNHSSCQTGSTNNTVIIAGDFKSENNNCGNNNNHHHHNHNQQQLQQHTFQQPKCNRQIYNDYQSSDGTYDSIYSMNAAQARLSSSHQHHYHASNLSPSSSSCSSSPSISNASSLAPSPLSLSSSSSSLCIALANTSFNHSSPTSSQTSSACSSNISSPICLSPSNQFNSSNNNNTTNNNNNNSSNDINYAEFQQIQQQQANQSKLKSDDQQKSYFNYYGTNNTNDSTSNESQQVNKINENPNTFANNEITATSTSTSTSTKNYNRYENETNVVLAANGNTNTAYNLYTAINPLDINRNYMNKIGDNFGTLTDSTATNSSKLVLNQSHLNVVRPVASTNALTVTKTNRGQTWHKSDRGLEGKVSNVLITTTGDDHQMSKRSKFDHNTVFSTVKKEPVSDCESFNSSESDSNSSTVSTGTIMDQTASKSKIFLTKLDQLGNGSYTNHVNNNTQLNIIKIASNTSGTASPTTTAKTIRKDGQETSASILGTNSSNIRFTIATQAKLTPENLTSTGKTIIQYKQLSINPTVTSSTNQSLPVTNNTAVKQKNKISSTNNVQSSSSAKSSNSNTSTGNSCANTNGQQPVLRNDGKAYPKPPYSYSCLIAMALRNSDSGTLPVSDIYEFIVENFPYYKTARDGWKNSIRHNLSLNKCFEKIENPTNGSKKGCLWALNPDKCKKLEEECKRCRQRDPVNIRLSMSRPDDLNKIERGEQRIKKYTSQRKLTENCAHGSASNGDCLSSSPNGKSSSFNASHISIVPTANVNNGQITINTETNKKTDSNFGIIEWDNKDSLSILKEEVNDHYYDELGNGDINFDILPTVSPSVIRTNV